VSVDTATKSSDIEIIDIEEDEGDVQSSKARTALSLERQAAGRPARRLGCKGYPHQAPAQRMTQGQTRG
jgi:hypothetical protein